MSNCGCINNFTEETFMESFGDDEFMKKCNGCDNLDYKDGNVICKKFGGEEE